MKSKELTIVYRDEKGEIEYIIALANSKDATRNFVKYKVDKLSFDELADESDYMFEIKHDKTTKINSS
jgi:hypothetical protein